MASSPIVPRLRAFRCTLTFLSVAFATVLSCPPGLAQEEEDEEEELEQIIVQATRAGRTVGDEPIRVEMLDREEIEERLLMTPGSIAMLVTEAPGVRTQMTSPSLGGTSIRLQGMKGRYTQFLADGLPLYGGQAPSIGLLQIPPTDLGQVEVIKGAASALYGPSALGGVINLVSRRPGTELEADVVLNATSRTGQDATLYVSGPLGDHWGASITGGFDRQSRKDLNDDGWADLPAYRRWTVRPRLFAESPGGATLLVTAGAMKERRKGGTLLGRTAPDGQPFQQILAGRRFDGGLVARVPLQRGTLHVRASAMLQNDTHQLGATVEENRRRTYFGEAALSYGHDRTSWLAGAAVQADIFRSRHFPAFNFVHTVPALFAQVEHDLLEELVFAGSFRWDQHNEFGARVSPRLSLLYKPGSWTIRASLGRGFHAPTPLLEDVEETGLSRLRPPGRLIAETADTASLDIGYSTGPIRANVTLFGSNIDNAVRLTDQGTNGIQLLNIAGMTRTRGAELQLRYRWRHLSVTGSYVYVAASEPDSSGIGRRTLPYTPKHTGGIDAMWEDSDRGRIGLELHYVGRQHLDDNPYRAKGRPHFKLGALGELIVGKVRFFVNAENILNVRQTKYDPLLLTQRAPDGRWTVDAWAPLDGFVLNGGVRLRFGGD